MPDRHSMMCHQSNQGYLTINPLLPCFKINSSLGVAMLLYAYINTQLPPTFANEILFPAMTRGGAAGEDLATVVEHYTNMAGTAKLNGTIAQFKFIEHLTNRSDCFAVYHLFQWIDEMILASALGQMLSYQNMRNIRRYGAH